MLLRDVGNLRNFFGQFAPELKKTEFGPEIWQLFERGLLTPETPLTGKFDHSTAPVDLVDIMREIEDAMLEEKARLLRMAEA